MPQQDLSLFIDAISTLKSNEWIPVISALGGTVVGAITTYYPTKYLEDRRAKEFSKQVQNCIIAEISALIRIIENRKYVESIEDAISHLEKNPSEQYQLFADIPLHYSKIYQEQCKNIGVLDRKTAREIINFYQLIDAVVQDLKTSGSFSTHPSLKGYKESLEMFKLAIQIGKNLEKL